MCNNKPWFGVEEMPSDNKKEAAKILVNFKKNVDEIEFAVKSKNFQKEFKKR